MKTFSGNRFFLHKLFNIGTWFLFLIIVLMMNSCSIHSPSLQIPVKGYQLFWEDDFNGLELDMTKWSHRVPGKRRNAFNVPESVSLDGKGHLVITTNRVGKKIHTGMIGTEGNFETTFGYFECRVRLQRTHGNWSAFWLQSPIFGSEIGNPKDSGAEIDIYECFEAKNEWVVHNVHWDGYKEHHKVSGSGNLPMPGLMEGWHTFGLEWTPDEYIFYIDGKESWRTDKGISHTNEYIILSLEVGKKQAQIVRQQENFEESVFFDYVRVYKKGNY